MEGVTFDVRMDSDGMSEGLCCIARACIRGYRVHLAGIDLRRAFVDCLATKTCNEILTVERLFPEFVIVCVNLTITVFASRREETVESARGIILQGQAVDLEEVLTFNGRTSTWPVRRLPSTSSSTQVFHIL